MGSITRELSQLLDRYGAEEMEAAIQEAIGRGVPHPNAVRLALGRRREARQLPPPVAASLSPQARQVDVTVQHHRLDTYDQLATGQQADDRLADDQPADHQLAGGQPADDQLAEAGHGHD